MKIISPGKHNFSRRAFLKTSAGAAAGFALLPDIIPSRLLGAEAPGKKIQVAQIGCGRMGHSDMVNVMNEPLARVVAICDLDSKRVAAGKKVIENYYSSLGESAVSV